MAFFTSSWKPEVTRRNSDTARPSCLAALGRRSGPRTMSATRKTTMISGAPMLPTRLTLPVAHPVHGVGRGDRLTPDGDKGRLQFAQAAHLVAQTGGFLDRAPKGHGDGSTTG